MTKQGISMGANCHRHYHSSCCCCVDFCCESECCLSECGCLEDRRWLRISLWVIGVLIVVVGIIIFIVWLALRPTKPSFYLKNVTVNDFNLSLPSNILSTNIQVTVVSHNGNDRVGVYYDRVDVFAAYRDQQITLPYAIPHFYQGHDDTNVWSPYLFGDAVPVQPNLCLALQEDEAAGILLLNVKIDASIRWKVGLWTSSHYGLDITCTAAFSFHNTVGDGGPALQFLGSSGCSASV